MGQCHRITIIVYCDHPKCKRTIRYAGDEWEIYGPKSAQGQKKAEAAGWRFEIAEVVDADSLVKTGEPLMEVLLCLCPYHAQLDYSKTIIGEHEHIFIRTDAKGVPTIGGSRFECFFCGRHK